MERDWHK
jgi:hypothetical protein